MLERKMGIPFVPDKLDIQQVTTDISTVQCNLLHEAHYAYTSWVITSEGIVVIDTGTPPVSVLVKQEIKKQTGKPVKYLIYTHGHLDHVGGASAYTDDHPIIIAHENILPRFERYELTYQYIRKINNIQFHIKRDAVPPSFIYPTQTYRNTYHFQLGGKTFELFHEKGETDDHTIVWMPESRAVFCGDLLESSFPNLGNPFKVMRYAGEWANALEKVLALDPDFAIGGDVVLTNKQEINEVLGENIELLRFLQDSVVKMANEGKTLEQMIAQIKLPPHLENSPNLRQTYSQREFAIYNIWKRYCGYFDFSPTSIFPRPKEEMARVARELIGNDQAILAKAARLTVDNQLQLALETLDIILKVDYENVPARQLRRDILMQLAAEDICLMSRNVWVHYLEEDERFLGLP
ncbi:alkyl sulfatase dimerization domain-containing protein [Chloroflexota bacterium]